MKLQFSGHESFICKHFWLKKGYDFINQNGNFNDESSVVELGVGKNMVLSISHWLKAFGVTDQENTITEFGHYLFNDHEGADPYVERAGSLWLLHYNLIKTGKASINSLFFNEFRRSKHEFTKEQLAKFCAKKIEQEEGRATTNTVNADIAVFIRSYRTADLSASKNDIEDEFSNLLLDLELMESYQTANAEDKSVEWYRVANRARPDLPAEIVLYTILDNPLYGKSVPFRELLTGHNSPGAVFALHEDGLFDKIEEIVNKYRQITYTETAGVKEFQIKGNIQKQHVLNGYYQD